MTDHIPLEELKLRRVQDTSIVALAKRIEDLEATLAKTSPDMKLISEALQALRWFITVGKWLMGAGAIAVGAYHAGGELVFQGWKFLKGG